MNALLFVPLLALSWILGFFLLAHAGHYFLSIVESSAVGLARNVPWKKGTSHQGFRDAIDWPEESFHDFFWKGFHLVYLTTIWAGPAIVVSRIAFGKSPWATAVIGITIWLLFPIGVLSSLASASRWNPLWLPLLVGLLKRPIKTLAFYLLSLPVVALFFITFDRIMLGTGRLAIAWAVALCPLTVLAFFVYARLIGRLGLVLSYSLAKEETQRVTSSSSGHRRKKSQPTAAYEARHRFGVPTEEVPIDTPIVMSPYDGEVLAYGVSESRDPPAEEPAKPASIIHKFDDEDDEPIRLAREPETLPMPQREDIKKLLAEPPQHLLDMYVREKPTEPANPYGAESVTFLFDSKTLVAWIILAMLFVGLALFQRALNELRPIGPGEAGRTVLPVAIVSNCRCQADRPSAETLAEVSDTEVERRSQRFQRNETCRISSLVQ